MLFHVVRLPSAKVRHLGGGVFRYTSILVDLCRFLPILRLDIYAIMVGKPLYHIGRQGTLSLGHTHLPQLFLMGSYPIAQGSRIHSGISRQLLSCHCLHKRYCLCWVCNLHSDFILFLPFSCVHTPHSLPLPWSPWV